MTYVTSLSVCKGESIRVHKLHPILGMFRRFWRTCTDCNLCTGLLIMNHNRQWYPQNNGRHNRNNGHQHSSEGPSQIRRRHILLMQLPTRFRMSGVYPPASATPTNHDKSLGLTEFIYMLKCSLVSRRISSTTLTAAPRSTAQKPPLPSR
jgi:hypothetical protein